MNASTTLARMLALEPRAISYELTPSGAVVLTQADETGLTQLIVIDACQLQALLAAVRDDIASSDRRRVRRAPKKDAKAIEPWGPIG